MLNEVKNSIKESTAYKKFVTVLSSLFEWVYTKFCFGILSRFERSFVKFLFVGLMNTTVSYIFYAIAATILSNPAHALFVSYVLGVLFNFHTTGRIVFKNKDNALIFKFILSYVLTFLINKYCLEALVNVFGVNKYLSQALLVPAVSILTFLILKYYVFKSAKS